MKLVATLLVLYPFVALAADDSDSDSAVKVVGHPEADQGTTFVQTLRPDEDAAAHRDLADALELATGTSLRRLGGVGRPAYLSLRGGAARQAGVFLDGLPLHGGRGGAFDLSTLPLAYVDRVDVLRGPAGAAHGSGAQSGALRLRTRDRDGGRDVLLRARLGSANLAMLDGVWADGDRKRDLLVAGSLSAAEGDFSFEDANGARRSRAGNDHRRGGGLLRGRTDLGAGRLTLLVEGTLGERGEPGSEQLLPHPQARSADHRILGAMRWAGTVGGTELSTLAYGRSQGHRFDDPAASLGDTHFALHDQAYGGRGEARWRLGALGRPLG